MEALTGVLNCATSIESNFLGGCSVVVDSLFYVHRSMLVALLCVLSSFAVILARKRELVALF